MKTLGSVRGLAQLEAFGDLNAGFTSLTYDSRKVVPGSLFVAIAGIGADRHHFLAQALDAGAAALIVQADRRGLWQPFVGRVPMVVVENTQTALAMVAADFYEHPARGMLMIGVTGTDGKSTTTELTAQVFASSMRRVGMLSTVAFRIGERRWLNPLHATTLEASEVQSLLADMRDDACDVAVVEASSHGLALHRVDGCEFDVGVFTTFTPDHLDYHVTMEAYREAKGRLFQMLDASMDKGFPKIAVLNADDPSWTYFRDQTHAPIWTYGIDTEAMVRAESITQGGTETRFRLVAPPGTRDVSIRLPGRFNITNTLAAATAALSQGIALDAVCAALPALRAPEGRMELIDGPQPFTVIVDFAATPDAIRKALGAARSLTRNEVGAGRLLVLFGCAGGRDPGRRAGMGAAAGELADFAVFTNEDPRDEDPNEIIRSIAEAYRATGRSDSDYLAIADRREAIDAMLSRARPGDVLLICGKATEPFIEMKDERIPWDERGVVRELIAERYRR